MGMDEDLLTVQYQCYTARAKPSVKPMGARFCGGIKHLITGHSRLLLLHKHSILLYVYVQIFFKYHDLNMIKTSIHNIINKRAYTKAIVS